MTRILFLNHSRSQCGVYDYGIRIYNIWKQSQYYVLDYYEVSSLQDYESIPFSTYHAIIYNYHPCTMTWLNQHTIKQDIYNIGLLHECITPFFPYSIPVQEQLPRPLFNQPPTGIHHVDERVRSFLTYGLDTNKPIIGSFGFGFTNKGFDKIIAYVNKEYDEAIIKIVMPYATYGDSSGQLASYVSHLCYQIPRKPGIEIHILHDYLDHNDILYFLGHNTINLFMYDRMEGRGISSTIDYALSVSTPIGISDSYMFRHIYHPSICVYSTSIRNCIENAESVLPAIKLRHSHEKLIQYLESYLQSLGIQKSS